jgi:hypothetical protein
VSRANGNLERFALRIVTLDRAGAVPDTGQVLRYLGYPPEHAPDARIEQRVREAIEGQDCGSLGTFALYAVLSSGRHKLSLPGDAQFTGSIGEFVGSATRVGVFIATAGPEIVQRASELMRDGDMLGGLILNAIGSHMAEVGVERVAAELRSLLQPGEALSLPFSPGYCGISLVQQKTVFSLVDGSRIGVELLPTMIMKPLKSVSGLIGIGPEEAIAACGSPCDRCTLLDCAMRRTAGSGV